MQEEVNEKVIAFSIKTGKLTAEVLQKSMKFFLAQAKKQIDKKKIPHGKQTLKQLAKQNAGVSNIEVTKDNIKAFESTAEKYGIDFALKKDATENPPRYLVFFKGRDADAMTAAFKEFSTKKLSREKKPSLMQMHSSYVVTDPKGSRGNRNHLVIAKNIPSVNFGIICKFSIKQDIFNTMSARKQV